MLFLKKLFDFISKNKKIFWVTLATLFVVCRLATWFYPINSDHSIFYYVGKNFVEGGTLYVDAWDHKPPVIFLFNGIMHLLFGGNIVLHRIFLTFLAIFDIYLFYKILQKIIPKINQKIAPKLIKIGLILYVFWRNLSQFTSSGNNTENFGLIFLLLMFLAFFKFKESKKLSYLFGSGVCLSFLFLLKGNLILLSLPIAVEILIENWKNIKKLFLHTFVFAAPLVVHLGLWLWYFYTKGALYEFFFASFIFSSYYLKSTWAGKVSPHGVFIMILSPFVIPIIPFIIKFLKGIKEKIQGYEYRFVFFTFCSNVIIAGMMGAFYPYYFLILLPGFILVTLYGYSIFYNLERKRNLVITGLLILGMIISFGMSYKQLYNSFSGRVWEEAQEFQEIADYIKSHTNKEDKITAYTYGATFYWLADRDSASKFVSASVLLLDERENYGFHLSDKFIDDLNKNKPKYVIISQWPDDFYLQNKKIVDYIYKNFTKEKSFNEFVLMRNNGY